MFQQEVTTNYNIQNMIIEKEAVNLGWSNSLDITPLLFIISKAKKAKKLEELEETCI